MREYLTSQKFAQKVKEIQPLKRGFDYLRIHTIITDENANIVYANKIVEEQTGYSLEEIIGKNPADLWGGKMPKDFYEKMWHVIKVEKKAFVGEVTNSRKDGTQYWQELYISPILDENENVKFFIGMEPNITERKEREKFREEFISIVSHQIRNPLVSIRWIINLLFRSKSISLEDRKRIEEIYKQNQSLIDLVGDLLTLVRVGRHDLEEEVVDLGLEIDNIIKEVKRQNSEADFSCNKEDEPYFLTVNKPLALQVFSNIIYNAAEYSDKNAGKVDIKLERKDSKYLFSSFNNGPEIPEEIKPKIFTKLFTSKVDGQTKKQGAGLGLFIVKSVCDSFGWKVRFESEKGKGTTFFIEIPIVDGRDNTDFEK